ncbi:replication protein [Candidatus Peregrinibacteria bacterium]|nr:replication protein [Candidatus Peregrinibacteria bacterium]
MEQDGFTKIPNEILEEMARSRIFTEKARVFFVILRKTSGWNKEQDWIALSQFVKMTGIDKPNVCRALRSLQRNRIVVKTDNKYRINGIPTQWEILSKGTTFITMDNCLYQKRQPRLSKSTHTKETVTKHTVKQKTLGDGALTALNSQMNENQFETFWHDYPRKINKQTCRKIFLELDSVLFVKIMTTLQRQRFSEEWENCDGKFIPYPVNWLNNKRWEDEV